MKNQPTVVLPTPHLADTLLLARNVQTVISSLVKHCHTDRSRRYTRGMLICMGLSSKGVEPLSLSCRVHLGITPKSSRIRTKIVLGLALPLNTAEAAHLLDVLCRVLSTFFRCNWVNWVVPNPAARLSLVVPIRDPEHVRSLSARQ